MKNKEQILQGYKLAGKQAKESRELLYYQSQKIGNIPLDIPYSDENYYDFIGSQVIDIPAGQSQNEFLVNIPNKLALIDFKSISGNRDAIFNKGLQEYVPSGDSVAVQFTDFGETSGYDKTKFTPNSLIGGELIKEMRIAISSVIGTENQDTRTLEKVVPTAVIEKALLPAITSGLSNGWPQIFDEQMKRTWEKFRFDRSRQLFARAGGVPQGETRNEWFNPATTWKKNTAQFIKINKPIKDAESFQDFLIQLYGTTVSWYGNYRTEFNPAGIPQIWKPEEQSVYMSSDLWAYWKTSNAVVFNSESIDVQHAYKSVEWIDLLPSVIDPSITKIKAILYADGVDEKGKPVYPFLHYPFILQPVRREVQSWAANLTTSIYDHFWLASGINLSVNIAIFYEDTTPEKKDVTKTEKVTNKENKQDKAVK